MLRQFQVADDLGTQKAHHIGELGELVSGENLLRHRRAADERTTFEQDDLLPRPGEIGRGHQPVMASTYDNGIILIGCHEVFLLIMDGHLPA